MNYEKQVKELEEKIKFIGKNNYSFGTLNWEEHNKKIHLLKQKAKDLKANIEKGCGNHKIKGYPCGEIVKVSQEELNNNPYYNDYEEVFENPIHKKLGLSKSYLWKELRHFCPTCQNLINRLNKIIGEENDM